MGHILIQARQHSKQWSCFVNQVKSTAPTYPSISTYRHKAEEFLCSNVRIERDGVWYKIALISSLDHCNERNSLEKFATEAYKLILLYKVTGLKDMYGIPLDIKDDDQRSEEERLTEIFCLR